MILKYISNAFLKSKGNFWPFLLPSSSVPDEILDEHGDVVGDDDIGSGGGIDDNISIIMMVLVMMMVVIYSSGNDNDSNGGDNDKYDNGYIIIMSI